MHDFCDGARTGTVQALATQNHAFCDGCGQRLTQPPIIKHIHGENGDGTARVFSFDKFECYEKAREGLGLVQGMVSA